MKINIGDLFIWLDTRDTALGICIYKRKKTVTVGKEEQFYIYWSDSKGTWYTADFLIETISAGDIKYCPINNEQKE